MVSLKQIIEGMKRWWSC